MRRFWEKRTRWGAGFALLLLAAGCAGPMRITAPFRRGPAVTVDSLTAPLRDRVKPVETLFLRARVSAWQRGLPGRRHFDAMILIDPRGHRLRLRAFRDPGALLIFDILADPWGIRYHDVIENLYYAADYKRLRDARAPWAGLSPSLLTKGLLVEHSVLEEAASADVARVRRGWRAIELRLRTSDARLRVRFDRTGERILALTYDPVSGEKPTRVRYGEMNEVDGVRLPQWVEIDYDPTRTRLRLDIAEYKINGRFPPDVFVLRPPAGQEWLPLETVR